MRKSSWEETETKKDEVEEIIQAAQDQVLLKLSMDSHITSASGSSNNYLDSDLERRFEALKSRRSSVAIAREDHESKAAIGDDLSVRFAALKAKLNPSSSSTIAAKQVPLRLTASKAEEENEEDEVERLIQWAKDAARLDPFPPSDGDEVEVEKQEDEEENDYDDEDYGKRNQNRRKQK